MMDNFLIQLEVFIRARRCSYAKKRNIFSLSLSLSLSLTHTYTHTHTHTHTHTCTSFKLSSNLDYGIIQIKNI